MKKFVPVLIIGFFILHLTAQPTYADWGWCLPPWSCPPSAPAPATKPAAPTAVVPPASKPDDFYLANIGSKCEATGLKTYLKWTPSNNAQTYEILRRKAGDKIDLKTAAPISTTKAPDTKFVDSVEAETSYEYLIKAVNSQGTKFSDFSADQEFPAQSCNPAAISAARVEQVRQQTLQKIKATCTYLEQIDQDCVQAATNNCLAISDETEQNLCIEPYRPNVPTKFTLSLPTLACDASGNGINLSWNDSFGAVTYKIYRKINNENYKLYDQTRAIVWTDRNIPNNIVTVSYRITAESSSGLIRNSNEVSFPQGLIKQLLNCRKGGPGFRDEIPNLPPDKEPVPSFFASLSIQRVGSGDETDPNAGYGQNADTFAPNEQARFGAKLSNSNLKDNNGCPVVGVTFKFLRINDDGTTSEVKQYENRPVCDPYLIPLGADFPPGDYIFRAEFNGEQGLGAALPEQKQFRVTKEADVPTNMKAYINGRSDTQVIFQDSPEFTGTVNIGAKVFVSSEDENCIIKPVNLKLERVADQNFKPLPVAESVFSTTVNDPAANCQSYTIPQKGALTEPGVYKLTASFIQGARGTALKPVLESTATMFLKKSGFGQAIIDATIGGALITKAKSKGAVAGIAVQKVGDQIILKTDPATPANTIPIMACVRPKNNPANFEAISGVRIMVEKFDTAGNPIGEAFNEVLSNDCQQRDIDVGSTEGVGCYNFNILDEDEDYVAKPVSKRLCFTQTPAQAKLFTSLTIDPIPGTISSVDDPIVTVYTNQFSEEAHFAVLVDNKGYSVSPSSSVPVSDACKTGAGDCVYQLQIYKPNGNFEVKFCHDNQNNCTEPLTFSTNPAPVATDPDQIVSIGLIVEGTEIPLPFDGNSIGIDLAPLSKQNQVFRLAIHRADRSRDTFPSLTFIYDEELGATVPIVTPPGLEEGAPGGETAPQPQACIPGEYKREPTGACGGCPADAGEVKVSQCRPDGSGFDEQGGECREEFAGPCQSAPVAQCDGDYAYWDDNALQCIYKKVTTSYPDCEYDFVPTETANCGM